MVIKSSFSGRITILNKINAFFIIAVWSFILIGLSLINLIIWLVLDMGLAVFYLLKAFYDIFIDEVKDYLTYRKKFRDIPKTKSNRPKNKIFPFQTLRR